MNSTIHSVSVSLKPHLDLRDDCPKPEQAESKVHQTMVSYMSDASTISSRSTAKRLEKKQEDEDYLEAFLQSFNFKDGVNQPQTRNAFVLWKKPEMVYPIHVAAKMGDYHLFRLLVAAGADINQKTSKGLCAIDVALLANKNGSHAHIIDFLKSDLKEIRSMRSFREMMENLE